MNMENYTPEKKKFSIVIPAYNAGKYINRSVGSVIYNNFNNYEVIIVDDGSNDNTKDMCQNFILNDSRISYLYQKNSGPNVARNKGLQHAKGEYIIFLDADDKLVEGALDILNRELRSETYDFVNFGISFFDCETSKIIKKISHPRAILENGEISNAAMTGDGVTSVCWSKAINRNFLTNNKISFIPDKVHGRDIIFSRILATKAKRSLLLNDILVQSYETKDSFSRSFSIVNVESAIRVSRDSIEIFKQENISKDILYYSIYRHLRYVLVLSSFRLETLNVYRYAVSLVLNSFPEILRLANCKKAKDFLFLFWIKLPVVAFLSASVMKLFSIRPY